MSGQHEAQSRREVARGEPLFNVVLHEPEIPNNTGNIGRTCVALGSALHLVRPLGFDTDEHALRRAGLDYWARLRVVEHDDWGAAERALGLWGREIANGKASKQQIRNEAGDRGRTWVFSTKGSRPHWEGEFRLGDALVFGKETAGLPGEILDAYAGRVLTLPMMEGERSLNLATAVCAVMYEAVRQCVARGELGVDARGRLRPGE